LTRRRPEEARRRLWNEAAAGTASRVLRGRSRTADLPAAVLEPLGKKVGKETGLLRGAAPGQEPPGISAPSLSTGPVRVRDLKGGARIPRAPGAEAALTGLREPDQTGSMRLPATRAALPNPSGVPPAEDPPPFREVPPAGREAASRDLPGRGAAPVPSALLP
jgi:hypothetical protein